MLRLVHLSDIHFSFRASETGFNPDRDLRRELVRDLAEQAHADGKIDAILVSGDVAYAGKPQEYADAAAWLDELCDAGGCPRSSVFVCTGNHDIDQDILKANSAIQDIHDAIRREETHYARDTALMRRLQQPEVRNLLYAPLREYNDFAARYECSFFGEGEAFAWDRDLPPLDDGSILRIRGLNSALLSGLSDRPQSLFLGSHAWTMPRHDGIEYLAMSHHPPNWLLDGPEFERGLRARIQLFGHEHDQRILPARDWVRLYAGSVNPHRGEPNWQPGYNIIDVAVANDNGARTMEVGVHVRVWLGPPPRFRTFEDINGERVHRSSIPLPSWTPRPLGTQILSRRRRKTCKPPLANQPHPRALCPIASWSTASSG